MPNIPVFNAEKAQVPGVASFHANDRGADAIAQAGRTAGAMASASGRMIADSITSVTDAVAGAAEDHYGRRQALDAGAEGMQLYNRLNGEWNARRNTADPRDPTTATKFNEEVLQPALEAFSEKYSATGAGQAAARSFQSRMMDHFGQVQVTDASVASAQAAEQDVLTLANNGAAVLMRDPSALDFVNGHVDDTIKNYMKANPNLTAEGKAHLEDLSRNVKRTNTLAAGHAMAQADPAAAKKAFVDGGFGSNEIAEGDRASLVSYAEEQVRRREEQAHAAKADARIEEQQAANVDMNKLLFDHIDPASGGLKDFNGFLEGISDWSKLHPAEATGLGRAAVSFAREARIQDENGVNIVDDATTRATLESNILLPPGDPNRPDLATLYQAGIDKKLNPATVNRLIQMRDRIERDPGQKVLLSRVNQAVAGFKSSITHSDMMGHDADGDQAFALARHEVDTAVDAARAAGTLPELVDRNSPNYIGRIMEPYFQPSSKEQMQRWMDRIKTGTKLLPSPGAPAPGGGEKPDAVKWLEQERARKNAEGK